MAQCPHCEQELKVDLAIAGTQPLIDDYKCPICRKDLVFKIQPVAPAGGQISV